jgi:plastocyanin
MTVVREGEDMTVQTDGLQLSRTFAMTLVSYGYGVVAVGLAYFLVVLALPLSGDPGAPPIPLFVTITAIFAVFGAVSVVWSEARRRAWFWLGAALPGLLILLMNAPFILHDITRPANTNAFLVTIVVLSGGLAVIVGGIAAFLDVRRDRPAWTRSGRAGSVSIAVIGALAGAATTSLLAGVGSAGGAGVAEAPTITGVVTAENTAFVEASLHMTNGEVLGLFVVNKDGIGHTFEVDGLGIHVELPPNSTTAVAIKPTGSGSLEFYCNVPGHREAGMVGTINVE